jgi:hypothetical protein
MSLDRRLADTRDLAGERDHREGGARRVPNEIQAQASFWIADDRKELAGDFCSDPLDKLSRICRFFGLNSLLDLAQLLASCLAAVMIAKLLNRLPWKGADPRNRYAEGVCARDLVVCGHRLELRPEKRLKEARYVDCRSERAGNCKIST